MFQRVPANHKIRHQVSKVGPVFLRDEFDAGRLRRSLRLDDRIDALFAPVLMLARALLDDGRPDRALEALDRVLKFDPEHEAALFHRGVALARTRRYDEAVRAWERVVQVDAAGPFAQAARTHARSARDLAHIFAGAA